MNAAQPLLDDRAKVLNAIREALRLPTPSIIKHGVAPLDRDRMADGLPPVAATVDGMLATFTARCAMLRTEIIVVDDLPSMKKAVRELIGPNPGGPIAFHQGPLVSSVVHSLGMPTLDTTRQYDKHELERCSIGITGCFALVAQTGSVMAVSSSTGGRALSALPPHHVVLATFSDLVVDLPMAFGRFTAEPRSNGSSMMSLISGPSRTGDIERILVLGAHGPKRVTVVLVKSIL